MGHDLPSAARDCLADAAKGMVPVSAFRRCRMMHDLQLARCGGATCTRRQRPPACQPGQAVPEQAPVAACTRPCWAAALSGWPGCPPESSEAAGSPEGCHGRCRRLAAHAPRLSAPACSPRQQRPARWVSAISGTEASLSTHRAEVRSHDPYMPAPAPSPI